MDCKGELKSMTDEVSRFGIFTVFRTSRFRRSWQARVLSVVGDHGEVIILGIGTGRTEEAACADCLWYWAHRRRNPYVPSAGSLEELRLKMSIGGRS